MTAPENVFASAPAGGRLRRGGGVLMIAGALTWLAAPVMLFIGGFVSLTENLAMIAMGIWMLAG